MWSSSLFALLFADAPKDLLERSEIVWAMVGLTASLIVGALVIYAVDKWRKQASTGSSEADEVGTLSSYRAMFEAGEITETEYAELRKRVADRVKKPADTGAPAPTSANPTQPTGGKPATDFAPAPPAKTPDPPPPA